MNKSFILPLCARPSHICMTYDIGTFVHNST